MFDSLPMGDILNVVKDMFFCRLDEVTKRLHKDGKRLVDANTGTDFF